MARVHGTGLLNVTSSDHFAQFALHDGQFLYARAEDTTRLGDALCAKGLLTAEMLEGALAHQRRKKYRQPLATVLFELGLVSAEVAAAELEEQIFATLAQVLMWEEGAYEFVALDQGYDDIVLPGCTLETQLQRIAAMAHA